MARKLVVGCVLASLAVLAFLPARAATVKEGTIVMATAGSPAVPRMTFVLGGNNVGDDASRTYAVGYVTKVPAGSTHFRLRTAVPGSLGDFDIFFYTGTEWPEQPLPDEDTADQWAHPGGACDALPSGAKWAIVTLSVGAADRFALAFDSAPLAC